jgi:putative ABC transport system permease protein
VAVWRHLARGLRALLNRPAADRDIADEVEHYFSEAAADLEARGLSSEEARRLARLELGSAAAVRERIRGYGWENLVDAIAADVRFGARQLRRRPAFTLVAILTLALGIGASTTIFSAVNPVLFRPLPYPQAEQLMIVWDGPDRANVTFGTYKELAARSRTFASLAVMRPVQATLTGVAEPERLEGQYVSANYFRVLGIRPALGRDFRESDDRAWRPGGPFVVLIADALWRRRFNADPAIVGRQILLNDNPVTVIGVLPPAFENVLSPAADIWSTLQYDPALPLNGREWGHNLRMIGRLHDGVVAEQARQELETIARVRRDEFPRPAWASLNGGFTATPLQDDLTRAAKPALLAILGAVAVLLTIACVNITNLLLARGAERRGELGVRAALGASRLRLIRQLLAETLLLAVLGGVVGIAFAHLALDVVVALSPADLPRVGTIAVDGAALTFATGLMILIGGAVGLVPALRGSRAGQRSALQQRSPRLVVGSDVTRRALVVIQVALALVLMVGAGLLLRSVQHLFAVPTGFDPANVLTLQVQTAGQRFRNPVAVHQFFERALDAVRQVPGVTAAASTTQLPLSGDEDVWGVRFESPAPAAAMENPDGYRYAVSPGYFEAMGIRLVRGRLLNERDIADAPPAAIINESFARRRLPGVDPIGQRVQIGPERAPWFTVVGVVADTRHASLALRPADIVYMTSEQWAQFADGARWLVVRGRESPAALTAAIRAAVSSIDKDQPIVRVETMEERVRASEAERRLALLLFEAFSVVALMLAAIGTYSLLSGSVTERLREIAVRTALGASRSSIVALVLRQGVLLTAAGVAIGLAAALFAGRLLDTLLFGVARTDLVTYAAVIALLTVVSVMAAWLPAWRAARVDPNAVLRTQ